MDFEPSSPSIVRELGIASALALLAACGPGGPGGSSASSDSDTDVADADTDTDTDTDGSSETAAQLPDIPPPDPMCTEENYETHAEALDLLELVCVPIPAQGLCPPCNDTCAYELSAYKGMHYDHTVLCSEVVDAQCCHLITASELTNSFVPGRPLREDDRPLLPALVRGPAARASSSAVGDAYRELARCERASVEAFVHCAELLAALGAPPELVERNREAAREELGHARLALCAAQALDGCTATLTDTPHPRRPLPLHDFVGHLVRDGCLGEAAAAREASWALRQTKVAASPKLREFWRTVAREEAEHAALAWATLEFLLARVPTLAPTVDAAMREALAPLPPQPTSAEAGALEGQGIASSATRTALFAGARDELLMLARERVARAPAAEATRA